MGKLRMGVLVTGGMLGLIFTPGAWAATGCQGIVQSGSGIEVNVRISGPENPIVTSISAVTVSRSRQPVAHNRCKPAHPARSRRARRRVGHELFAGRVHVRISPRFGTPVVPEPPGR